MTKMRCSASWESGWINKPFVAAGKINMGLVLPPLILLRMSERIHAKIERCIAGGLCDVATGLC